MTGERLGRLRSSCAAGPPADDATVCFEVWTNEVKPVVLILGHVDEWR